MAQIYFWILEMWNDFLFHFIYRKGPAVDFWFDFPIYLEFTDSQQT